MTSFITMQASDVISRAVRGLEYVELARAQLEARLIKTLAQKKRYFWSKELVGYHKANKIVDSCDHSSSLNFRVFRARECGYHDFDKLYRLKMLAMLGDPVNVSIQDISVLSNEFTTPRSNLDF